MIDDDGRVRHTYTVAGEWRIYSPCTGCIYVPPSLQGSGSAIGDPAYMGSYRRCGQDHHTTVACPDCGATVVYTFTWADGDPYIQAICVCGTRWNPQVTPDMFASSTPREQVPDFPPEDP